MVCEGKFSETFRQPVSSLTAVEETHPAGYASLQTDPAMASVQPGRLQQITVVAPDFVPGLDMADIDNQSITPKVDRQSRRDVAGDYDAAVAMARKEFGTQTGVSLLAFIGSDVITIMAGPSVNSIGLVQIYPSQLLNQSQ